MMIMDRCSAAASRMAATMKQMPEYIITRFRPWYLPAAAVSAHSIYLLVCLPIAQEGTQARGRSSRCS